MVFIVGTNQQMLAGELEKLLLFIKAEKRSEVGKTDLEILTVNEADAGIWELTDALATRNRTKILGLANKIMQTDQDFHQILLPMIARQIKILFLAKQFPADQLVRDFKLHPYAVKKAMEQARSFEVTQLKQIFNKIINLDYAVKQGKIEPRLGLNLLLSTV
jgi:DNA polymerase-3 subunit delta